MRIISILLSLFLGFLAYYLLKNAYSVATIVAGTFCIAGAVMLIYLSIIMHMLTGIRKELRKAQKQPSD